MRGIFYVSILTLFGLAVWAYSTAKNWQEIAAAADRTQARAAKVTKKAMDRADRCVSELQTADEPKKKAAPGRTPPAVR